MTDCKSISVSGLLQVVCCFGAVNRFLVHSNRLTKNLSDFIILSKRYGFG
jgi:hypothetical protein